MRKVYIPNRGPHNYSDAEQYGELVYCSDGELDKFDTALMYRRINDAMQDSTEDDYIVMGSLASLCCVACGIFSHKHGCLNLLIHRMDGYVARSLFFYNQRDSIGNY